MNGKAERAPIPPIPEEKSPRIISQETATDIPSQEEFARQIPELTLYLKNYLRKNYASFFKYEQNPNEIMEDLVQETLLKTSRSLDTFRGQANLKTWLARIFINNLNDYFRKKNIDPLKNLEPLVFNENPGKNSEKLIQDMSGSVLTPEELLLEKERSELQKQQKEKLDEAINALPERGRIVFKLYLEGLKEKQIANQVGTTEDAVKNYLFRARRRLKSKFGVNLTKNK